MRAAWLLAGLLLWVSTAGAQQRDTLRTRADSLRADSLAKARTDSIQRARAITDSVDRVRLLADSLRRARLDSIRSDSLQREDLRLIAAQERRADSIKAPLLVTEMPVLTEHSGVLHWNREQLGASGALTLGELLESVPGLTVFRIGWLASPEQGAYLGDFGAIRIIHDGVELDPIDPRTRGIHDLSFIQLWQLEEVRVERGASEIRVYTRTWQTRSTTPSTRIDINTGDLATNAYRGYFSKRYTHGEALQVGLNQWSLRDDRGIGSSDQVAAFVRLGWAWKRLTVDGNLLRLSRDRGVQPRTEALGRMDLPLLDASQSTAYARVGYADTTRGWWVNAIASTQRLKQNRLTGDTSGLDSTTTDSSIRASRPQYVLAAGWARGMFSASATVRARDIDGQQEMSTMLRGSVSRSWVVASGTAEQRPEAGLSRVEGSVRVQPLSFLSVSGAVSRTSFEDTVLNGKPLAFRGEGAWRVSRMWIGGGVMGRDLAVLRAPAVFDSGFVGGIDASPTGTFVHVRGKFYKDVGLDLSAIKWDAARGFRPQYQSRSRLYVDTSWPSRFPSGNLNILFAITHDYRTQVPFRASSDTSKVLSASQFRLWGMQLEIKLLDATLTYQFRNALVEQYEGVPGFASPRPVQYYGVRWNFFN